jgi:hypothetical protein
MALKQLLKFYRYACAWEDYLLLARTIEAAWLVRRHLREGAVTPRLEAALPAVTALYLPPQPRWHISDAEKIARFASVAVLFPTRWGRCLQRALIMYRLLNGYGIPTRVCLGIDPAHPQADGHAWVTRLSDHGRPFAETPDPRERFTLIYASRLPNEDPGDGQLADGRTHNAIDLSAAQL